MLKLHSLRSFRFNILPHLPERGVYLSTFVGDNFIIRGEMQMEEKGAKITVTRVFADKRIKLFDLFSNFVAKRIMAESGMIPQNEESSDERISNKLDIADLKW